MRHICIEILLKHKQKALAHKRKRSLIDELKQRFRYKSVVDDIKRRAKQIFWKNITCTIIKQGGLKIRVNKEIRGFARRKWLKKNNKIMLQHDSLTTCAPKKMRHLSEITEISYQKKLKNKVNRSIRQISETRRNKRRVCEVVKQTGLKFKCCQDIQHGKFHLRPFDSQHQVVSIRQGEVQSISHQQNQTISQSVPKQILSSMCEEYCVEVTKSRVSKTCSYENILKPFDLKKQQEKVVQMLEAMIS